MLHDTIEDPEELVSVFGKSNTKIVLEVSNDKPLPMAESKLAQIEHARHPCPFTGKVNVRYGCKGYVINHIDPLACGGEDKAYNMQWQTKDEAKLIDKWERKNCSINKH